MRRLFLPNISAVKSILNGSGLAVFQHREYRYFWTAAAFSNIGMWALIYGRLWLMHSLTDSPLMVGLVTTASLGPVLVLSLWGGALADRINRLRMVQVTRGLFALLALFTGVLVASGVVQPWHVVAISVVTGALLAFDIPSRSAMLPALLPREQLASGVALYSLVFGGAAIAGPALFAPLVELWGLAGIFFIIGGAYILTVLVLLLMDSRLHRRVGEKATLLRGAMEGIKYLRRHRPLLGITLLGVALGLFGSSFEALLPAFADNVLTGGVGAYSRLLLAEGIGALAATLSIAILGSRVQPTRYLFVSGLGFGLALLVLGLAPSLVVAALIIGLVGGMRVVFGTMSTTMMQTLAAEEFRGRVMSLHQLTWGSTAIGSLMMGALGEGWGVSPAISAGGVAVAISTGLVALWVFRKPQAGPVADASTVAGR
jgi:MFS family permease